LGQHRLCYLQLLCWYTTFFFVCTRHHQHLDVYKVNNAGGSRQLPHSGRPRVIRQSWLHLCQSVRLRVCKGIISRPLQPPALQNFQRKFRRPEQLQHHISFSLSSCHHKSYPRYPPSLPLKWTQNHRSQNG